MPGHDIIVMGASAGGVEALMQVAKALPADIDAAIFVVLHVPPHGTSALPKILDRISALPSSHAADGEPIKPGRIYVAPPDHHLLIRGDHVHLSRGPSENGTRPAIDPLFRSAATSYGSRVIGVVLSGSLDDGTAGLIAIKRCGGLAVVQDPDDALYPSMPRSAVEHVQVDHVRPISEIGSLLAGLVKLPAPKPGEEGGRDVSDELKDEVEIDDFNMAAMQRAVDGGTVSPFTCPACSGVLWETEDGDLIRYRCRVGHAYTVHTLVAEQTEALEGALWQAFRALRESGALSRRLASRSRERGNRRAADRFEEQAREADERADIVRKALVRANPTIEDATAETLVG